MPQVQAGSLIRNARASEFGINMGGTLGCLVQSNSNPGQIFLLTAAHVIGMNGYARTGDSIEARVSPGSPWIKVAEFETAVKFRDARGVLQSCDAALARLIDNTLVDPRIDGIGQPSGLATGLFEGMRLQFRGAQSGVVRSALVHSTGNVVPMTYAEVSGGGTFTLEFGEQVLYGQRSGEVWSASTQGKDSGALVLDHHGHAVGLHLGRTPTDYPVAASVLTPIRAVLDALDVSLLSLPTNVSADVLPAAPAALKEPVVPADGDSFAAPAAAPVPVPVDTTPDGIGIRSFSEIDISVRSLMEPHNPFGGVEWQLMRDGVIVNGRLDRSPGTLVTVPRVWNEFGALIVQSAAKHRVPVELILATMCTESSGRPRAEREEPGWQSDELTPHRVSAGLMQTLISTAREATKNNQLTRASLFQPDVSIDAGTAYMAKQRVPTRLDPPLVACAYNAGNLFLNRGDANRWKIKQFPIGTGAHADRFVQWFNDCFAFFASQPPPSVAPSYFRMLNGL